MKKIIFVLGAAVLVACDGAMEHSADMSAPQAEMAPAPMMAQSFSAERKQSDGPGQPNQTQESPSAQSFLAYRYNYTFALPVKSVAATAKSHAKMCIEAGADKCQLLSSNTSAGSKDYANAYLQLRAEPKWLETFTSNVQSSVKDAKGDMTNSGVTAEDLTRSILDTDARLKAQLTLRTRLEGLLETRNAKLPDLLALERELARVQGQIESATTTLNVLKKRVSMSVVDLNYQTKQVAVSRGAFSPIGGAQKRFAGNLSGGIAGVIDFASYALPWLVLIVLPGFWLFRRYWRGRRIRKAQETAS